MGALTSKVLISDPQLGSAVWFLYKGGLIVPPYWWVAVLSFQIPLTTTYVYVRHSVAGQHRWVVVGCASLLASIGVFQFLACTTDPGIIPRQAEEDPTGSGEWAGSEVMGLRVRMRDKVELGEDGEPVVYRWCKTCQVHRPPRAAHCDTLDCCVKEYDHFCPVVASCVAQRTLRYFVGYLASCGMLSTWVGSCTYYLLRTECGPTGRHHLESRGVESMCAAASVGCGAGVWTCLFTLFYIHLISTEHTQRESFRGIKNPYARHRATIISGCRALWIALCASLPLSKLGQKPETEAA